MQKTMGKTIFDGYCCPFCSGTLTLKNSEMLICRHCSKTFRITKGVPIFNEGTKTWEWQEDVKVNALNSLALRVGWKEAIKKIYEQGASRETWIADFRRGAGLLLPSLSSESVVLDVGCGWGVLSFFVASFCKEVHAIDPTFKAVEFVKIRAEQDGIINIFPARTDLKNLPFKENYFDLVILNGVVEWLPVYYSDGDPLVVQMECLKKLWKITKPEGALYLGIENRFGLNYWLGLKDEHSGLRFVTILPRKFSNFYSKIMKGTSYRTYTYSFSGLKRLLKKAGFRVTASFMPIKNYRDIKLLINLENSNLFPFALKLAQKKIERKLRFTIFMLIAKLASLLGLHKLGLHKFFSPSFVVIGKKETPQ